MKFFTDDIYKFNLFIRSIRLNCYLIRKPRMMYVGIFGRGRFISLVNLPYGRRTN